jgi:Holliday junction resolvasome RuvABC endonuclease subunit
MRVLGIDPGSVSAAFALYDTEGLALVDDVPTVDRQVDGAEFARLIDTHKPDMAIIENVGAFPKQGISSSFRFGMGCGLLRGVVLAKGIPLREVSASNWKKHFKLNREAEKSRSLAIKMFPAVSGLHRKRDHNRAEALLLAVYCAEVSR